MATLKAIDATNGATDAETCVFCKTTLTKEVQFECTLCHEARVCGACSEFVEKLQCCAGIVCKVCLKAKVGHCERCAEKRCIRCLIGGCADTDCPRLICDNCLRDCSVCKEQFCSYHVHKIHFIGANRSIYQCAKCFLAQCKNQHCSDDPELSSATHQIVAAPNIEQERSPRSLTLSTSGKLILSKPSPLKTVQRV